MTHKELNQLFSSLPSNLRHPMLRFEYVEVMANQYDNAQACFFLHREEDSFFYHPFLVFKSEVEGRVIKDIESAYGFGGAISSSSDIGFIERSVNAYREYCIENNFLVEFIRYNCCLKNSKLYDGQLNENRDVVVVDLTLEVITSQIQARTRSVIRKAKREGIRVIWSKDREYVEAFIEQYYETMTRLRANSDYFFPKSVLRELVSLPFCELAIATFNGQVIAGASFFIDGDYMEYHLSANNQYGQKLNATKLIIEQAMLKGKEYGAKYLHLGGGYTTSNDDPLLRFKMLFSKKREKYVVGHQILDTNVYQELKQKMLKAGIDLARSNRVIFYR
ncbi:GNAT family N-acetyltransferase [Pseudoalteromonas sp. JC3]|uniref:GNAT family N-acetyltransferase n=1 Tax=Pseudoalteromonas sp. JC3 TaxID=2810196 RepID=UPI0019D2ADB2|nr:GNAT family N-acetyltransferase [Pseudoalteromonas sp. JC3]MBR8842642.1 GNAT family N-acetyltransferase [Pseudoalteromonas sp. JC3]WJE10116.1 GNAT family N-acetyltransferase [Pseudoalteromonas sp. JC3]